MKGQSLDDVVSTARRNRIPVYMIRTAFNMKFGAIAQDVLWKDAIERTGGRDRHSASVDADLSAGLALSRKLDRGLAR